jgi:hypothetical protein
MMVKIVDIYVYIYVKMWELELSFSLGKATDTLHIGWKWKSQACYWCEAALQIRTMECTR